MSDANERRRKPRRAYTGDTVIMPVHERAEATRRREEFSVAHDEPFPAAPRTREPQPRPVSSGVIAAAKRRRFWRRVRLGLLGVVLLLVLVVAAFYAQVRSVADAIVVPEVRSNPSLASPLVGGANILLIGVDERRNAPAEGVRSDTLILAHVDAFGRWASLLSIPRDTQIELPEIGITKINTAYYQGYLRAEELYGPGATPQQGGMALAAQEVEDFLGLRQRGIAGMRVDYVAQVNFDGFAGLIDVLGGITIDVPRPIVDEEYPTEDFGYMRVEFQPGPQRMDGTRALIYARTRHADSDFGRAERQQQVLRAIVSELRAKGWAGRVAAVPGLLSSLRGEDGHAPPVVTTFPIDRPDVLMGILLLAAGMDPADINQVRISPEFVGMVEDGSNLVWDQADVQAQVDAFLTKPSEASERATVQVFNGAGVAGLAGTTTAQLDREGFRVLMADNAPPGDYQRTLVYDRTGKSRTAKRVGQTLGAEVVAGDPPDSLFSEADIVVVLGLDKAGP